MPPAKDPDASPSHSPSHSSADADLVQGLLERDRGAFSELYDRHARHVYAVARKISRCDADAETVVSDVFFEVWRKPERFDESRGTCRTYLMVLARSRALDLVRKQSRRNELASGNRKDGVLEQVVNLQAQQPEADSIRTEQSQQVREAIRCLDEKQREPVVLAFFGGLTHQQISDRLEQPLGTVKTRIRAALQSLRGSLRTIGRHDDELP